MIQKVNLKENVNAIDGLFLYKRVGTLNNHMLNVLQAEHRTLDFHIHENSDELFYCTPFSELCTRKNSLL